MRQSVHDSLLKFRANAAGGDDQEGGSRSAQDALRIHAIGSAREGEGGRMSEDELIALAAQGSREAQAALVELGLHGAMSDIDDSERLAGVEITARMAASHGWTEDRLRLAGILLIRSADMKSKGNPRSAAFMDEAIGILEAMAGEGVNDAGVSLLVLLDSLADDGNEPAGEALNVLAERLAPFVMQQAQAVRAAAEAQLAPCAEKEN